jgi:hypothetical protein
MFQHVRKNTRDAAFGYGRLFQYARGMRIRSLLALVCLLVSALAFAKRSKTDCSKVSMTKLEPGWGKLDPALQKLPPGATLCGNAGGGSVFVLSELDRAALEKFYAPLFASVGCKLTCTKDDFTKVDRCDCPKAGSGSFAHDTGYVHLQPYDQAYQLFFAKE